LHTLQRIEKEHSGRIEEQHPESVPLPIHVLGWIDLAQAVDKAFDRRQDPIQSARPAFVHSGHVPAQGFCEPQQDDKIKDHLSETVQRHQNFSGLSNAIIKYTSNATERIPPKTYITLIGAPLETIQRSDEPRRCEEKHDGQGHQQNIHLVLLSDGWTLSNAA
jgi:hypothetical protein